MTPILDLAGEGVEAAVDAACRALSLPGAVYRFAAGTLAFLISYAFDLADHRSEETKTIATQN